MNPTDPAASADGGAGVSSPPPHMRHNFAMLVGDVSCFLIGMAFIDSSTALPALIDRLGGGPALLGLLNGLRHTVSTLPLVFVSYWLHGQTRHLPFLLRCALLGRVGFLAAAVLIALCGNTAPGIALIALMLSCIAASLGDGAGGVPWTALVGRMIPARRRGQLFATVQMINGVARIGGVGTLVAFLLGGALPFPWADSAIVLGCAVAMAISWVFLALLREPPPGEEEFQAAARQPRLPLLAFLRAVPGEFRARPDLRRLALVQLLSAASVATSPFLLRFTQESVTKGLSDGIAGRFLIAQTAGTLLWAWVWGILTDRVGPKLSLGAMFAASLLWPALAGLGRVVETDTAALWLFYAAYFCLGGTMDMWVGITNYQLEVIAPHEQPKWLGLLNTAATPGLLLPILAGLLVSRYGSGTALILAALLFTAALAAVSALPNTRRHTVTLPRPTPPSPS